MGVLALLGSKTINFLCPHPQPYFVGGGIKKYRKVTGNAENISNSQILDNTLLEPKRAKTPIMHSTYMALASTVLKESNETKVKYTP